MRRAKHTRPIRWQQYSRAATGSKVLRDESLTDGSSVYHYLEYPHALSIFSEDRLRLANPSNWADPYEQEWCRTIFGRAGPFRRTSAYVLCWSRSRHDEPAWRMAGHQRTNPIVRIRFRLRDILAAAGSLAEKRSGALFTGKVCYEQEEELRVRANSLQAAEPKDAGRATAALLLRKRNAFRFENEVRTIWVDSEPQSTALFLPIDAKTVVRQV